MSAPLAAAITLLQMRMDDIMTSLETEDEAADARDHSLSYLERQASRYELAGVAIDLKC